jgi:hypothetical protein
MEKSLPDSQYREHPTSSVFITWYLGRRASNQIPYDAGVSQFRIWVSYLESQTEQIPSKTKQEMSEIVKTSYWQVLLLQEEYMKYLNLWVYFAWRWNSWWWFLKKENIQTTENYHAYSNHIDIEGRDLESEEIRIECKEWNNGDWESKWQCKTFEYIYLRIREKWFHQEISWKKEDKNRSKNNSESLNDKRLLIGKEYS